MKQAKYGIYLFLATLNFTGCSQDPKVYEVEGVTEKFCIPKHHTVPDIPWVPAGTPSNGFAFDTCWPENSDDKPICPFPENVRGGVVGEIGEYKTNWQDIPPDALYRRITLDPESKYNVSNKGSTIVISNPEREEWYIWKKATHLRTEEVAKLGTGDILVATCKNETVSIKKSLETRNVITCDRSINGKDYVVNYSFESINRTPKDIEKLDEKIFKTLDSWKCEK